MGRSWEIVWRFYQNQNLILSSSLFNEYYSDQRAHPHGLGVADAPLLESSARGWLGLRAVRARSCARASPAPIRRVRRQHPPPGSGRVVRAFALNTADLELDVARGVVGRRE